jgi:hypothetical protein
MSEAPGPTELATTQLLPYLAAGGNEEAWRAFVVRYRPRILRWCRRLQADNAEEVVYQARQLQPKRIVALKMIRAIEHAGPTERLRFQIETEAAARLQHPHIVQLYEAG